MEKTFILVTVEEDERLNAETSGLINGALTKALQGITGSAIILLDVKGPAENPSGKGAFKLVHSAQGVLDTAAVNFQGPKSPLITFETMIAKAVGVKTHDNLTTEEFYDKYGFSEEQHGEQAIRIRLAELQRHDAKA